METNKRFVQCKYGIYCKFGVHCRFYHPQMNPNQNRFASTYQQAQIHHLNQHFLTMNLNSQPPSDALNQQFIDDAHYQQFHHQQQLSSNYTPQKLMSENKINQKHKKFQQNSSDSNSDMESDSDEDTKEKVNKNEKVKEKKNQKINYLYGQDKIKKQNKKAYHREHARQKVDEQSFYLYHQALFQFFEQRHIKQHKREGILKFLAKQTKYDPAIVQILIAMIGQLEKDGFIAHCCYKKLFKTIIKENFQIEAIKAKLMKKISIDNKRKAKDYQFNLRFPFPIEVQFLQSSDLLQNHYKFKETIYLIDGNNCLTTQKHLRYFFQQKDAQSKAQAQIRFQWFISQVIKDSKRCFIFFDDKFGKNVYQEIMNRLMSQQEENKMSQNISVVYAESGKQADELIRQKLTQLKHTFEEQKLKDTILVTADRILIQQCYMIHPLRKSSGMYLIKFCKKQLKKEAKFNQNLKKIVKRILNYDK